ncbi:AbrB/MazE/SpoVT family DNA-binding domain-containing protein [Sphingoaurantiacus capsulatus]|uniref:AbrB/MazE/SpoVT family DNA-binding domain-containing protein n=1 Tax=Sphingoaurantiacus capsulatus TaxID=1771310 RepID=A0ABV7X996_9SPHN
MNKPVKLTAVGNSTGVILPKEVLARLNVERGDELFIVETPNGIELRARDPEFEEKMRIARQIMREDRDLLHALAQ